MSEQTIPPQAGLAAPAIAMPGAEAGAPEAPSAQPPRRRRRRLAVLAILLVLLGVFSLFAGWYLVTRKPISELPLPPVAAVTLPGYGYSIYGIEKPMGVAVSGAGDRIYATQTGTNAVVRIFDAKGTDLGTAKPPDNTGSIHVPVYVAIDPVTADVYVSDRATGSIYVYSKEGVYRRTFDPGSQLKGWLPMGIAFGQDGTMYVTDLATGAQGVHQFGPDGAFVKSYGTPGQFSYPNGLAVDANGNLYVANSNNGRVDTFGPDGTAKGPIARGSREGNLGLPRGVAVDDQGRVYVVDTSGQQVQVYKGISGTDRAPTYVGSFGQQGSADGSFEYPNGIAVDARGRLYVADFANNRIQIWSY